MGLDETRRRRRIGSLAIAFAVGACAWPAPGSAQTAAAGRAWTVEFHGVAALGQGARNGRPLAEFPIGETFTTDAGLPSRGVLSWYFGDGAVLFNQVSERFAALGGSVPAIVPLDAMLRAAGARRQGGTGFGLRVARRLSSRFSAEFSVDRTSGGLSFSPAAKAAIEESRESFDVAFRALLATVPMTNLLVTSTAAFIEEAGQQTSLTGTVIVRLNPVGRMGTYVAAGTGMVLSHGTLPEVHLRGSYQFRLFDTFLIGQSDRTTIRVTDSKRALVGVAGGGITYDVGARHGLRVDARLHVSRSRIGTSVEASPVSAPNTPGTVLPSNSSPGIQFSTIQATRSSLQGAPQTLTTFTGDGLSLRTHVTVGYFFRF